MLRSWSGESLMITSIYELLRASYSFVGLMYCYTHKERGVAALVEAIKIPVIEMRVRR